MSDGLPPETVKARCDTQRHLLLILDKDRCFLYLHELSRLRSCWTAFSSPKSPETYNKMVREKKAVSSIKAPSRAKPRAQFNTDDSPAVADNCRKTKPSDYWRCKAPGTQRPSKKPAPRLRHNTTDADVDGDAIDQEDDGEGDNDGNEGNDSVEDNNDEEDDNPVYTNGRASGDEEEEEEEEERAYEKLETELLKAKMNLLLIEQMKGKDGTMRAENARSERRLNSEVRELRAILAEETGDQEPTGGEKEKSGSNKKKSKSDASKKLWPLHGIIKEISYHYLVVWKGADEDGQPWDDWWVAKRDVNAAAKRDWTALRASAAKDRREKHKTREERERAKAQRGALSSGQGDGRGQDRS